MSELQPRHIAQPEKIGMITLPTDEEWAEMARVREAREAEESERYAAGVKYWRDRERRKTWKGRMKKVMAATALFATIKSGGFIDMAGDQFSDASDVAASAIPVATVEVPNSLDGTAFEDFPADTQAEIVAEEDARVERSNDARKTVIGLFDRLDKEGPGGIVAEVEQERRNNPDQFANQEAANHTKEAIDHADSNEQAVHELNDFMKQFDIEAGFDGDTAYGGDEHETKKILKAYVNVFSVLPKDFVKLANLQQVTVSENQETSYGSSGDARGMLAGDYGDGVIRIIAQNRLMMAAEPVAEFITGEDDSYEAVVAHELGHAFDENAGIGAELKSGEQRATTSAGQFIEMFARNAVKRPEVPSEYSRSDDAEFTAEVESGLLSDKSNGLATPDEWRRFGSESNKAMIEMLAEFESIRPGIAKILIANRLS